MDTASDLQRLVLTSIDCYRPVDIARLAFAARDQVNLMDTTRYCKRPAETAIDCYKPVDTATDQHRLLESK